MSIRIPSELLNLVNRIEHVRGAVICHLICGAYQSRRVAVLPRLYSLSTTFLFVRLPTLATILLTISNIIEYTGRDTLFDPAAPWPHLRLWGGCYRDDAGLSLLLYTGTRISTTNAWKRDLQNTEIPCSHIVTSTWRQNRKWQYPNYLQHSWTCIQKDIQGHHRHCVKQLWSSLRYS